MQQRLSVRLRPAELVAIEAPIKTALTQLYLGTLDDESRSTIAAAINIAWVVCESVQRHQHLLPIIREANATAMTGYGDAVAIDNAMQVYMALCRTTPRKALRRAIQRALDAQETPS